MMVLLKVPVQVAMPVVGSGFGCAGVQVCASAGSDTPSDEDTSAEAARSQDFRRFDVVPVLFPPEQIAVAIRDTQLSQQSP
jgi:hypothetical protein